MSCPLHLLISILALNVCHRQAVLENGHPTSPAGMLQSLEVDLWNGDFLGTPLEWCQTWGHTAAQATRQLEKKSSHFSAAKKKKGGFPSGTYSQHHIVYLLSVWCNRAERGYVRTYTCLPSKPWLRFLFNQSNKNKIAVCGWRSTALLCLAQTSLVWNPILCCPRFN